MVIPANTGGNLRYYHGNMAFSVMLFLHNVVTYFNLLHDHYACSTEKTFLRYIFEIGHIRKISRTYFHIHSISISLYLYIVLLSDHGQMTC